MIPKEKAEELVAKFNKTIPIDTNNIPNLSAIKKSYERHNKECALIAVDEIIEATNMYQFGISNDKESIPPKVVNHPYWQEVKQEINNL